jgi:hypothetical protein
MLGNTWKQHVSHEKARQRQAVAVEAMLQCQLERAEGLDLAYDEEVS